MTNAQYYGLVGKGISDVSSSLIKGFGSEAAYDAQAGGYFISAEGSQIQAEQETINAEAAANARMEMYNKSAASNAALTTVMGKTGEGSVIDDENLRDAQRDVSIMRSQGRMKTISSKSSAAAARVKAKQAEISADAARNAGIFGAVQGIAGMVGSGAMIGGSKSGSKSSGSKSGSKSSGSKSGGSK